jgi:hypothetical protein
MTLHAKLGRRGGNLALAVGLDDATRDQHVSLGCNGLMKDIVELAQFVAAKAKTGRVLTLYP